MELRGEGVGEEHSKGEGKVSEEEHIMDRVDGMFSEWHPLKETSI